MELVCKRLKRKLPLELYGKVEALAHDLAPVMAELLEKRKQSIPQMVITTRNAANLRHLVNRYKQDLHSITHMQRGTQMIYRVEVGFTSSLHKVRVYKYVRQPRWMFRRATWREVGVLV